MRKYLLILAMSLLSCTSLFANPIDRLGVPGPLKFNQTSFNLAYSSNPKAGFYLQEYLPKNETLEQFNQMLSITVLDNAQVSIPELLKAKTQELDQRKRTDSVTNYAISANKDQSSYILDFIVSAPKAGNPDQLSIIEFNVHQYTMTNLGNGRRGLILYTYSKRTYADKDMEYLMKNLSAIRQNFIQEMATTKLPVIRLK